MKTITYPVCGCGKELRSPADGVVLFGSILEAKTSEPKVLMQSFTEQDEEDAGQAVCFSCLEACLHPVEGVKDAAAYPQPASTMSDFIDGKEVDP